MIQSMGLLLVALLMIAAPAVAATAKTPAGTSGERRESGTLVKVAPDGASVVLEEMGPWHGPGTHPMTRSIRVMPHATVSMLEHTGRWHKSTSAPGWSSKTVPLSSLRRGDFVTVTENEGPHGHALALQVVRPGE